MRSFLFIHGGPHTVTLLLEAGTTRVVIEYYYY